jgi:putative SOS response-associated peptidase YedK
MERATAMLDPVREFLPNYETGKAVRWRIGMASGESLAVTGLWRAWEELERPPSLSFTMLTVNADEHPLMKRFHNRATRNGRS